MIWLLISEISRTHDISRTTVYRILGDYGMKRKPGAKIDMLHRASMKLSRDGLRYANNQIDKEAWLDCLSVFESSWKDL